MMAPRLIVTDVPKSFHGLRYHRQIWLGADALPPVLLLEEIAAKRVPQAPEERAATEAQF
jgi:hypothetical protein